jgi:hypothetical protein
MPDVMLMLLAAVMKKSDVVVDASFWWKQRREDANETVLSRVSAFCTYACCGAALPLVG